jgi:adenylylsulfate kinase
MPEDKNNHIIWHDGYVSRQERLLKYGHRSGLVWFTGLSASGKSTIAHRLERVLFEKGIKTYALDGDNVRHGINSDLGFSPEDRRENLRRIAELARLFVDAGIIVLAAFISPYRKDREFVRSRFNKEDFIEVYVRCPVEVCEQRDPKGQYRKARAGIIKGYTGVDAPYEEPENPELIIDTSHLSIDESVNRVYHYLKERGWF